MNQFTELIFYSILTFLQFNFIPDNMTKRILSDNYLLAKFPPDKIEDKIKQSGTYVHKLQDGFAHNEIGE